MGKFKKNSIAKKILLQIGESCKGLFEATGEILFDYPAIFRGMSLYNDNLSSGVFNKKIDQLKRSRYLKKKNKKWYLTSKGRIKIIKLIAERKKERRDEWDGKWRGIAFDVPEINRRDRDFLRRELRWVGLKELQKSFWVYPFDVDKELTTLLRLWNKDFEGDIKFLLIEKIEDDSNLKDCFNLS